MPRTKISEFSATAASNTDIDSINIAEGCAPSGINDAIRELMSQLKDFQTGAVGDSFNGPVGTTTAAAGAFTTLSASSTVTLSGGTANGVAYLNGSKVVTSGSALTFDGTNFFGGTNTYVTGRFYAQRSSSSLNLPIAGYTDGSAGAVLSGTKGDIVAFGNAGGDGVIFANANTEQMRLTGTGLGIGTSSPAAKLHVSGSFGSQVRLQETGGTYFDIAVGGRFDLKNAAGTTIVSIAQSGSPVGTQLNLDSSGNLGLGVTPSAWGSGFKAFQIGARGSAYSGSDSSIRLAYNAYYDGTGYKRIAASSASQWIADTDGSFAWFQAGSSTAGTAITFTQAMTLNASGDLGLGTTSPTNFANRTTMSLQGAWGGLVNILVGSTSHATFGTDNYASGLSCRIWSQDGTAFYTSSGRSMTLDSSGNLLVGTTSAFSSGFVNILCDATARTPIAIKSSVNAAAAYLMRFVNNSGTDVGAVQMNGTNNGVNYLTSSDYRLKTVIGAVTGHGARLDALEPIEYEWKQNGSRSRGFLAHKFQEVYADSVSGTKDAVDENGNPIYQGMQAGTAEVIADLVAEIQSLRKRLADAGI